MSLDVAVIGTGFGRYAVRPAYESLGCNVTLVSPRDAAAVRRAVSMDVDLVSVHSPPFLHLEHVKLALAHGRDVLCDKPFGRNAGEAEEMLTLATEAGVLHFLNFEFRCDPQREKLKALLDEHAVGQPLHLSYTSHLSYGRAMPHGWLFDKELGGGWIGAFASHVVDSLHWLFGDVVDVRCQPRIDVMARKDRDPDDDTKHRATAEDAVVAVFRMENGVTACLDTSFSAAVELPAEISLLGSDGVIQLPPDSDVVLRRHRQEPQRFMTSDGGDPIQRAMQRWLARVTEAVKARQPMTPDFATGFRCARVLDAMRSGQGLQQ